MAMTDYRWRSIYDLAERGLLEKEAWQRVVHDDACKDPELAAILAHNRDEEKAHAAM